MKTSQKQFTELFLLFIFLIFPKIDLISIPTYHQGIRIEDIVVLLLFFILSYNRKIQINKEELGYNFILYFFIFLFSCAVASVYFPQRMVVIMRYLEYIIIIIYFNRYSINTDSIYKILRIYLLLNLIAVILQQLNMLGELSSLGYEAPANKTDDRPTGLTGGPWELANCSAIIFFCLLMDQKQSVQLKLIFSIISIFLIFITSSRTVMVAMFVALSIYSFQNYINRSKVIFIFLLLVVIAGVSYVTLSELEINTVYKGIPNLVKESIVNQKIPPLLELDGKLWSLAYRLKFWLWYYEMYSTNLVTYIFGIGAVGMYTESAFLRVLFGTGIVGFIFVLYSMRKIHLFMLSFLLISGLTLDLMMSFKIFFIVFIYFYLINKRAYENRN